MVAIDSERLLATFLELIEIDSPSGAEKGIADYCQRALEAAGCTVQIDDSASQTGSNTGNLIACLPAYPVDSHQDALPIYFSAHMDSVEPCRGIKAQIIDGILYSDGKTILAGDDKVGIAVIIELIRCLTEAEPAGAAHPEIRVLLSVKEEVGLIGAMAMDAAMFAGQTGAACYVLDAGGKPGLVVNGAPYHYSYRAEFKGLAAHAGIAPNEGISAIRAAASAVAKLPQGRIDDSSTINVGSIQGGSADNVVAAQCLVTGELRSHSLEMIESLKTQIEEIFKSAATDDGSGAGAAEVVLNWSKSYEGFYAAEDSPQVELAFKAARSLGLEAKAEISNGGADTNILAAHGLAAVSLGSGMEHVHSTAECLEIEDMENLARLALAIVYESL